MLDELAANYPLSFHGVGLGLCSIDPPDRAHLERLRRLVDRHQPAVVSEHLCWGSWRGVHFNDLLPVPLTTEALELACTRVSQLQDYLRCPVLIEHLATYVVFAESDLDEACFLAELAQRTGCGLLLDLENLYVNYRNHVIDPAAFLTALPAEASGEIHLAGHTAMQLGDETVLIDTHGSAVCAEVWDLYRMALLRFGARPTLIEWDTDIPPLETLLAEAARADAIVAELQATGPQ